MLHQDIQTCFHTRQLISIPSKNFIGWIIMKTHTHTHTHRHKHACMRTHLRTCKCFQTWLSIIQLLHTLFHLGASDSQIFGESLLNSQFIIDSLLRANQKFRRENKVGSSQLMKKGASISTRNYIGFHHHMYDACIEPWTTHLQFATHSTRGV